MQRDKFETEPRGIIAIQHPNRDNYPELGTSIAYLGNKQFYLQLIVKVLELIELQITPTNYYSTGDNQKYLEQLPRLSLESWIYTEKIMLMMEQPCTIN